MAHEEYEKAREFIEEIVLSFNRELKRESDRFQSMAGKVDESYSTADLSYRKADNLEKRITSFEGQLGVLSQSYQLISQTITEDTINSETGLSIFEGLEPKLKAIEAAQETLKNKIADFEDQIQKLTVPQITQEVRSETSLPTIIIKRDKALAALTDTEIVVLEMLSKEGSKTAPEIKEKVHLSREHTARLMKKLYEEGYLEREVGKIPFKYSIKKEMEVLLHKTQQPAAS
jgi:hypothetical protein